MPTTGGGITPGTGATLGSRIVAGLAGMVPSDGEPGARLNDGLVASELEAVKSKMPTRTDLVKDFIGTSTIGGL